MLLRNLLLALAWTALTGRLDIPNLALGYALGYFMLWIVHRSPGPTAYFRKTPRFLGFVLFYLWKLVLANLRVAHDVLTPRHHMRPGVIAVPLDAQTDTEITLLASLMTLTPGALSLDVSADRRHLYLHVLYIDDPDTLRAEIKEGFERRLLELLR